MLRRYVPPLIALALAVLGVFQGLQFFAVICLLMAAGLYYKHIASRLVEVAIDATKRTQSAKVGSVELTIGQSGLELDQFFETAPAWMKSTLTGLEPGHIGLLVLLGQSEKIAITPALEKSLRELRARGLVLHEMPTLAASSTAWLSQTGRHVVELIADQTDAESTNLLGSPSIVSPLALAVEDEKKRSQINDSDDKNLGF